MTPYDVSDMFCIISTRKFCTAKLYCEILHTGEEKKMYFTDERTVSEKKQSVNRHVGEKIRAIRTANAMTQTEFINSLELKGGKTLISQVEHGKKRLPSSVLPIIAEQGNVTVESLFRDAGSDGSIIGTLLGSMQVSHRDKDALISYMNPWISSVELLCLRLNLRILILSHSR